MTWRDTVDNDGKVLVSSVGIDENLKAAGGGKLRQHRGSNLPKGSGIVHSPPPGGLQEMRREGRRAFSTLSYILSHR